MRFKSHAHLVEPTLKTALVARPIGSPPCHLSPLSQCRCASTSYEQPKNIAIFGGGIAGLSSAYFISKRFPNTKITVFEAQKDLGGWIKSKSVAVPGGKVLFESGPRTLRVSTPTLLLIQELGLAQDVLTTKKTDVGAQNRFIYYPDRLNRLRNAAPGFSDLFLLWRSGLLAGVGSMLTEFLKAQRPANLDDETIGSFISRRFDQRIADNIISAVFHGIYAGDIWQLSVKSILGILWHMEGKYGSTLGGYLRMNGDDISPEVVNLVSPYQRDLSKAINQEIDLEPEYPHLFKDTSVFTFKNGMHQLVQALHRALLSTGNVQVRNETRVQSYKVLSNQVDGRTDFTGLEVVSEKSGSQSTENFSLAVSSLHEASLTPFVTVMTVNLFYENPDLLPVQGFGYLIPRSIPFEQNPERALGVIFDSSAIQGQDSAPGTKLTVMIGGHWWDGWTAYPTESEGLEMAVDVLKRHLGITDSPIAHTVTLSKDCIPQYTLGYAERLKAHANNLHDKYKGRLRVVGNQVNGVGVNDCITAAWKLARGMRGEGWKIVNCGLDRALDEREWVPVPASEMVYRWRDKSGGEGGSGKGEGKDGGGGRGKATHK